MNDIPTDVLIIGAGPAGITAGVELLRRSSLKVSIVEASSQIGGISTTADQNGNLMDLGGHRFFSKSKRVMDWWFSVLPLYIDSSITSDTIAYQGKQLGLDLAQIPITNDEQISSFRIRPRTSRILFRNHLLPYPLQLSSDLLHAMGVLDTFKAAIGLVRSKLAPIRPEITLEDFFINRFGRCLYQIFFEEYSEKVWGKPCRELSAEWGAQRVKGVSIIKALKSSLEGLLPKSAFSRAFESRVETSLIEQFLYPTRGPGELWQCAMTEFLNRGGKLVSPYCVSKITPLDQGRYRVTGTSHEGENISWVTPTIISSMPITDFFAAWDGPVEESTREIATNLQYRDFIVVGLLYEELSPGKGLRTDGPPLYIKDNWIYVQEPGTKVGRIQFFNNWSPYLVRDPQTAWVGLEYFASQGDELWQLSDQEITHIAAQEFKKLGFVSNIIPRDSRVIRVPKAYPVYSGAYKHFEKVMQFFDTQDGIYPIGRNGMHRYNNQDHSMLTAFLSVDQILTSRRDSQAIWSVNAEQEYHEEKS